MKSAFIFLMALSVMVYAQSGQPEKPGKAKVLLFTKATGYLHKSLQPGSKAIIKLCAEKGLRVDSTSNADLLNKENLSGYVAIIFYNTCGTVLDDSQRVALKEFIRSGKGYAGIHCASACEYDWLWYGQLVGAFFDDHPKIQTATLKTIDSTHSSTSHLPDEWLHEDEWYNYRNPDWSRLNILLVVEEETYSGGKHGKWHPISWYHEFDGGRSWYTAIGHSAESFNNPLFAGHILGGILYAAGLD